MKYLLCLTLIVPFTCFGQKETRTNKKDGGYVFSNVQEIGATEVKNQFRSGTCWSFSGLSLFESEMIRMGMEPVDLSEMYIVRRAYEMKAERFVRMQGKAQFGPGGQFHDIIDVVRQFGILSESEYGGQPIAYGKPHHNEMDAMLKGMVNVVVKNPNKKLSPYWKDAINGALDAYLGEVPSSVDPMEKSKSLGLDWDSYIEITSFSHLPYYEKSLLLIPDNWTYAQYYNLPIDEYVLTVKDALKAGFTVGWDADVSDRGFSFKNGVAIYPDVEWSKMSKARKDTIFNAPSAEEMISEAKRQELFDNYVTTDDHLMHIVGSAIDQNGTYYFLVKNSWGSDRNDCGGFIYVSEAYFRAKTIAIMLHKDGVKGGVAKKLKL